MYKTIEYRVKVTVQTVDGCGNSVMPPTAGDIRRVLVPLADSVEVDVLEDSEN